MYFSEPIKMVRATHYGNNYWEVYSNKLKRKVCLFSNLEYDNYLTLEMNPLVEYFCEQPLVIDVVINNKVVKSTFDMWVKYFDGHEEFQEVKYSAELSGNDKSALRSQEQIRRQRMWCEQNNIDYTIRTENEINVGEFTIRNYAILAAKARRYSNNSINQYEQLLIEFLSKNSSVKLCDLLSLDIMPINNALDFLCFMYYKGAISMNLDTRPLDFNTEVKIWQKKN